MKYRRYPISTARTYYGPNQPIKKEGGEFIQRSDPRSFFKQVRIKNYGELKYTYMVDVCNRLDIYFTGETFFIFQIFWKSISK